MKRFLVLLVFALCLLSCENTPGTTITVANGDITIENVTGDNFSWQIKEVTYRGETHEYLIFQGSYGKGLAHWEGCKYCKEHKQ